MLEEFKKSQDVRKRCRPSSISENEHAYSKLSKKVKIKKHTINEEYELCKESI